MFILRRRQRRPSTALASSSSAVTHISSGSTCNTVSSRMEKSLAASTLTTSHILTAASGNHDRCDRSMHSVSADFVTAIVGTSSSSLVSEQQKSLVLHPLLVAAPKLASFHPRHIHSQLFRRLFSEHFPTEEEGMRIAASSLDRSSSSLARQARSNKELLQDIAFTSPNIVAVLTMSVLRPATLPIQLNAHVTPENVQDPLMYSRKMRHRRYRRDKLGQGGFSETTQEEMELIQHTARKLHQLYLSFVPELHQGEEEKQLLDMCSTIISHLLGGRSLSKVSLSDIGTKSTHVGGTTSRVSEALTYAAAVGMTVLHPSNTGERQARDYLRLLAGKHPESMNCGDLHEEDVMKSVCAALYEEEEPFVIAQCASLAVQSLSHFGGAKEEARFLCLEGTKRIHSILERTSRSNLTTVMMNSGCSCEVGEQLVEDLFCLPSTPQKQKIEMFEYLVGSAKNSYTSVTSKRMRLRKSSQLDSLPMIIGNGRVFCEALSTFMDFGRWDDVEFLLENCNVTALCASFVPLPEDFDGDINERTVNTKRKELTAVTMSLFKRVLLEARTELQMTVERVSKLLMGILSVCAPRVILLPKEEEAALQQKNLASLAIGKSKRDHKYELMIGELPHGTLSEVVWSLLNFIGSIELGTKMLITLRRCGFLDLRYYPLPLIEACINAAKSLKLSQTDRLLLKGVYLQHVHTFSRTRGPSPYLRFGTGHSVNREVKDLTIRKQRKVSKQEDMTVGDRFYASARIAPGGVVVVDRAFTSWVRKGSITV